MSICAYHSPCFSEDIAWLPQWLQPHRLPMVGEHRQDSTGVSSPSCENCVLIGDPSQDHQNCQNGIVNASGHSGFVLHLSGDGDTPAASTPINSNVPPFSLHLSESAAELFSDEGNDNLQILNSDTYKGPSKGFCAEVQENEVNALSQNQYEAKDPQADKLPGVCKVATKEINKPPDAKRHRTHNVSGGKLRNADVNDAIELSIAASEAMVIAEMIVDNSQSDKLAAAALEAALHVKGARKQLFFEEPEHACGSSESALDETDWLAELDEAEMVDVFQDVGLSLVHITCSSKDHSTGSLNIQNYKPSCSPYDADTDNLGSSSEKKNKRWNTPNADSNDHVSDSFTHNCSVDVLPNEPASCYDSVNQSALGKIISCSRYKNKGLQVLTQNNAVLHQSLGAPATNQNVDKECGGISARMNVGTKKNVKALFREETSFISESFSMDECHSTSGAASMDVIASSRASFHCNAEGLNNANQAVEAEEECCQVLCSSLSLMDPLCSIVPCSLPFDEGPNSLDPVWKQSEDNEGPTGQAPGYEQSKGEEKGLMYLEKSLRMQNLDGKSGPACVPLITSPESNVPIRRREYSSLRPFSTMAPKSNILGGTSTRNADVAVYQQERLAPATLNKNIQRVHATKQFIENEVEAGNLQDFSMFQKPYSSKDASEHQIREEQIRWEVCQSTVNLNAGKQYLKRKRVQFSEAKLSNRRTKSNRGMQTKSKFSRSDIRMGETLETSEYIDNEAIFQGVEFLLTGFHNQKEKEIVSLIRKFGGYVLSKVPPFSLDKRNNMPEFPRWKSPIVLSPKKVSTAKFLYGSAIDAWMLNPSWLFDSLQAGVLLPYDKYLIRQRNALKHKPAFGHSVCPKNNTLIFDGVGFLIHGKISFCSKFSNIIKHGGGQVFVSLQALVQRLKAGGASHGIILVANKLSAPRHLSYCGLEHDIKTTPASWIIGSLFSGKLLPLKKDRCAPFRRIKMPSFQKKHIFEMSQEI